MSRSNNSIEIDTMYKKLLDDEGDLMFSNFNDHDEEDQKNDDGEEKDLKHPMSTVAVAVPVYSSKNSKLRSCHSCFSFPCVCKCMLVTLMLFILLGLIASMGVYFWMKDVVEHLTVVEPHDPFPIVDMSDAELDVVKDRVKLFVDQLRVAAEAPSEDLVVTQDEINGFIGHSDYLRGNMHVVLEEGKITEQYSLPVDMLPGGKGRYYVGEDYMKFLEVDGEPRVEFEMETAAKHLDWFKGPLIFAQLQYLVNTNGDQHHHHHGLHLLELYIKKGSWFGKDVPQDFIDEHVNLLEDFDEDPNNFDALQIMDGIESVSIEKGKIIIHPRNRYVSDPNNADGQEVEILALSQPVDDVEEDLTVTTSTSMDGNLRKKKDTGLSKVEESYTFANKIDGSVPSNNKMNHHDHPHPKHGHHHNHGHNWKKNSASNSDNSDSSSSDSSDSTSSDE